MTAHCRILAIWRVPCWRRQGFYLTSLQACWARKIMLRFGPMPPPWASCWKVLLNGCANAEDLISDRPIHDLPLELGRAHVCTPVTNAHLVCRLLLEQHK